MSLPELPWKPGSLEVAFLSIVARIQNHFKLPKITSKRSRDAFKREAVLESPLCWQVFINSHHTATPKKWLDLHCSSASVFIYSKMCDYKILLASNALQQFCKDGIKEYARYRHAENHIPLLFIWEIQIYRIQYNKETMFKENKKVNTAIAQFAVVQLC